MARARINEMRGEEAICEPIKDTNSQGNEKGKGSKPVKFPEGEQPKEGPKSTLWGYER